MKLSQWENPHSSRCHFFLTAQPRKDHAALSLFLIMGTTDRNNLLLFRYALNTTRCIVYNEHYHLGRSNKRTSTLLFLNSSETFTSSLRTRSLSSEQCNPCDPVSSNFHENVPLFDSRLVCFTIFICYILGDPGAVSGGERNKYSRSLVLFFADFFRSPPLTAPGSPRMYLLMSSLYNI